VLAPSCFPPWLPHPPVPPSVASACPLPFQTTTLPTLFPLTLARVNGGSPFPLHLPAHFQPPPPPAPTPRNGYPALSIDTIPSLQVWSPAHSLKPPRLLIPMAVTLWPCAWFWIFTFSLVHRGCLTCQLNPRRLSPSSTPGPKSHAYIFCRLASPPLSFRVCCRPRSGLRCRRWTLLFPEAVRTQAQPPWVPCPRRPWGRRLPVGALVTSPRRLSRLYGGRSLPAPFFLAGLGGPLGPVPPPVLDSLLPMPRRLPAPPQSISLPMITHFAPTTYAQLVPTPSGVFRPCPPCGGGGRLTSVPPTSSLITSGVTGSRCALNRLKAVPPRLLSFCSRRVAAVATHHSHLPRLKPILRQPSAHLLPLVCRRRPLPVLCPHFPDGAPPPFTADVESRLLPTTYRHAHPRAGVPGPPTIVLRPSQTPPRMLSFGLKPMILFQARKNHQSFRRDLLPSPGPFPAARSWFGAPGVFHCKA